MVLFSTNRWCCSIPSSERAFLFIYSFFSPFFKRSAGLFRACSLSQKSCHGSEIETNLDNERKLLSEKPTYFLSAPVSFQTQLDETSVLSHLECARSACANVNPHLEKWNTTRISKASFKVRGKMFSSFAANAFAWDSDALGKVWSRSHIFVPNKTPRRRECDSNVQTLKL